MLLDLTPRLVALISKKRFGNRVGCAIADLLIWTAVLSRIFHFDALPTVDHHSRDNCSVWMLTL
ncbi:hypothetical protein T10_1553 [Trichinella papuae]|uniref:Uncharacterized protein n=1 Tax=Trichinella papuae TaxID=268474 RepID=A0A0V1MI83_9BILA|nr:hypothetical protein T10_1553 [Trichinella papuae]